ncbi:MAG: insulinase family protein, partial [Candidatus Bathyarchaeia archaeon]
MEFSTLSNGLEYAIEKREGCGVVAIQVWVKVGSRQEQAELSGITHFIEHLIFKGTERLAANELASKIECMGGTINAFTSYDNTVYHMVIPKESFEEGLRILAESILNPAFPAEEVEKERRVILEEIKMGEDDPQRRLYKELFLLSFEGHPYGRPIIGFEETLYRIDRMHIMDYFRKHYTPHNMIVVIVGDVDEKKAKGLVEYSFKGMSGTPYEVALPVLPKGRGRQKVVPMDIKECYLALSYPIPPITHEDMPFLEIAASILGEGESSRLSEELKNRSGIVTEIGSFVFAQKDAGLFVIYATFNGKQQERVELAIEKVIRKILEGRLKRWEIEKAKNRLRASLTYAEETVQGRARQIGYFYSLTNRRDFVEWYMKRAEAATEKDIKRVIRKYLKGDVRNSVLLLPSTHNPKLIELENGLKVVMNRNGRGSFAFSLGFPGGLKDEGEGENGIFNLLARMLLRGTKRSTAQQIARRIDVLAGDITPFCGRNVFGLSGKFLSKDMEEVLSLLKELVAETLLNKAELERVKREVLSELRQKKDDPVSFTFRVFEEVFYDSHPYARDPSGSEDNVANARLEDLERCLRRFVAPRGAVLAISGDLDFDRA